MNLWSRVFTVLLALVATVPLYAAEFSSSLEDRLQKAGDNEFISSIVILPSAIDIRTLDFALHQRKATIAERNREVLEALKYNAAQNQPAFQAELDDEFDKGSVTGYTAYWIDNLFVVNASKSFLEALRQRGDVEYVTTNFTPELIDPLRSNGKAGGDMRPLRRNPLDSETTTPDQDAIGATRVNRELGITGQGVIVANCDTGVDGNHPALAARWRGNFAPAAECWRDALGTAPSFPEDDGGHGTHVMGTMAGRAISGVDTNTVGGAPNAQWIATNTINQGTGSNFDNDVIADYQWFANPDNNINTTDDLPDVIQNSWGVHSGFSGYTQCDTRWNTFILNCEAAGPVVTWSAGNEASSGLRTPAIHSMSAYQIFSVGAVDAQDGAAPYPIASFSSLGPTPCTPASPDNIKPEISAPGVNIYSSVPGGGYDGTYSGTSMAGPHVAGVVALMREACPDCDHITIKDAIMTTALDQGTVGQDNTYGHGVIQAYEAVVAVSTLGSIGGVVTSGGNPVEGAKAKITTGPNQTLTDAAGAYNLPLSEGTYAVEYSKFGYVSQTIPGLTVTEGNVTVQNVVLSLAPQGTLSGIVTDCFGSPAVGAGVELLGVPVTPTTTNGSGFYTFTIPQGTYDISAIGAGCGEAIVAGVVVGVSTVQNITLPNDPRYECSAPDAAGYIACENNDLGGPTFNWFEIAPLAGGPGTATTITTDDAGQTVTLPFTFRFYGVDYTSAWICGNGFASFSTTSTAFTNEALPSATIGAAIAPLWDDLYPPDGGQIAYYFSAADQAFIIEWYQISHYPSGSASPESFQIWLYNVATNPGPNGDSQIRIQYQTFNNATSATTGIGSAAVANGYGFNGTLDVNAQGLENGRVITYGGFTQNETYVVYEEDFESGAPGWLHNAADGWTDNWHISTELANSGTQSFKCGDTGTGNYSNLCDARLSSPVISDLPASTTLSFAMQITSELSGAFPDSAYDGGMIELSVDGGAWTLVAPSPAYTKTFRYRAGGGNPYSGPAAGFPCIAGSIATWSNYSINLFAYEGSDVQFRFRFGSDAGGNQEGWYIDDVVCTAAGQVVPVAPEALVVRYDSATGNLVLLWEGDGAEFRIYSSVSSDGPFNTLVGSTTENTLSFPLPPNAILHFIVVSTTE
jgi:subtilisin family serine protease